jgi:hypothetical protein
MMRKNAHYELQQRTKTPNGWLGWDTVKTKASHYQEEQYLPKKAEINTWFREIYAKEENLKIDWQAGYCWGCYDNYNQYVEYRVIRRKTGKQPRIVA